MAEPSPDERTPSSGSKPCKRRKAEEPQEPGTLSPERAAAVAEVFGLQEGMSVLLVGEGNLTFSRALLAVCKCRLLATTFEKEEEHRELFSASVVQRLRGAGADVLHGVDATKLAELPDSHRKHFDRIIFQFPQHPERFKIHLQRELLRDFLKGAVHHLAKNGQVIVSLLCGQGGTPAEPESARRKPKDTWQIQDAAAEAGLLLWRVVPCPIEDLGVLGYSQTGFRNRGLRGTTAEVLQDRAFNPKGSLTHSFVLPGENISAAFPLERRHDISFWVPESFDSELLQRSLRRSGLEVEVKLLDEYSSPKDGRVAHTYSVVARTHTLPLPLAEWRQLCDALRAELLTAGVEPRRRQGPGKDQQEAEGPQDTPLDH